MWPADSPEPDLTTRDVARALQLNQVTVQRMLASGRLRGYQVGRSWRVPRAALEEFRRAVRESPVQPAPRHTDVPISEGRAWLKAFKALSGSIAVPPPSAESLRREELYEDRR